MYATTQIFLKFYSSSLHIQQSIQAFNFIIKEIFLNDVHTFSRSVALGRRRGSLVKHLATKSWKRRDLKTNNILYVKILEQT